MKTNNSLVSKISYAVVANAMSLAVSVLVTLILPRFFGSDIRQFGLFQIFLFYVNYLGLFHFGWCDGIYLRDGGKQYSDLNKESYAAQLKLIFLIEVVIGTLLGLFFTITTNNFDSVVITWFISLNLVLIIPTTMLSYLLQTTNRIQEYSRARIASNVLYILCLITVFLFDLRDYKYVIIAYTICSAYLLSHLCYYCFDIVKLTRSVKAVSAYIEAKENIRIGISLLFANIANMLITGIVKWGIQQKWDIITYGKISLTLNVSNLLMVFISAIALVLYPILKNTEEEQLKKIYSKIRNILMILLLGLLCLYYPIKVSLVKWLPQYSESLNYMAILFPLCIFAAKMNMLVQTYMKVFRYEKLLLKVNFAGLLLAIITTIVSVFILENLDYAMFSIVFNQMFRSLVAETLLSKNIGISVRNDIIMEICMALVFIYANWYIGSFGGVILYFLTYFVYLVPKRKDIKAMRILFL